MMNNTNINYNELCTKLRSMKMSGYVRQLESEPRASLILSHPALTRK